MGLESTTKQELMRRHIRDVVERKKNEIGFEYDRAKDRYIEAAGERRQQIRTELNLILDRAHALKDEYRQVKKRLGYEAHDSVHVPELEEYHVRAAIERDFESQMSEVRRKLEDELEDAKLRATSNVLFAHEKRLREEVDRISNLKAIFDCGGTTPAPSQG